MQTQNSKLKTQNYNVNLKTDLRARCYYYSISIIKFLGTLPEKIVEAKSSSLRRDFIKFYEIALKLANESKYWFGLLRDATDADKDMVQKLLNETEEISRMLGSSLLTLKGKRL